MSGRRQWTDAGEADVPRDDWLRCLLGVLLGKIDLSEEAQAVRSMNERLQSIKIQITRFELMQGEKRGG